MYCMTMIINKKTEQVIPCMRFWATLFLRIAGDMSKPAIAFTGIWCHNPSYR